MINERSICVVHMAIVDLSLTSHKPLRPSVMLQGNSHPCLGWMCVINEPPCALYYTSHSPLNSVFAPWHPPTLVTFTNLVDHDAMKRCREGSGGGLRRCCSETFGPLLV